VFPEAALPPAPPAALEPPLVVPPPEPPLPVVPPDAEAPPEPVDALEFPPALPPLPLPCPLTRPELPPPERLLPPAVLPAFPDVELLVALPLTLDEVICGLLAVMFEEFPVDADGPLCAPFWDVVPAFSTFEVLVDGAATDPVTTLG
jgi:hypothetical protein